MARSYNPEEIETKWQAVWAREKTFHVSNPALEDMQKGKAGGATYILEMFPYPSGSAHMGHVKNYTMGDVIARFRRHQGRLVLHPMGYDAFGLNSENVAIQTGEHPAVFTEHAIATINRQLRRLGVAIDWDREVVTCRPEYYKWTQWLFLQFYRKGLSPGRRLRSTGARRAKPCWPMSRSSRVPVSAVPPKWKPKSSSSGSSA